MLPKLLQMIFFRKMIALFTWMLRPAVKKSWIYSFNLPRIIFFPTGSDKKCVVLTRKKNNGPPPSMFGVGPA